MEALARTFTPLAQALPSLQEGGRPTAPTDSDLRVLLLDPHFDPAPSISPSHRTTPSHSPRKLGCAACKSGCYVLPPTPHVSLAAHLFTHLTENQPPHTPTTPTPLRQPTHPTTLAPCSRCLRNSGQVPLWTRMRTHYLRAYGKGERPRVLRRVCISPRPFVQVTSTYPLEPIGNSLSI